MIARFLTTSFNAKINKTAQPRGKIPNIRRKNPWVSGRARAVRILAGANEKIKNQIKNRRILIHKRRFIRPGFAAVLNPSSGKFFAI